MALTWKQKERMLWQMNGELRAENEALLNADPSSETEAIQIQLTDTQKALCAEQHENAHLEFQLTTLKAQLTVAQGEIEGLREMLLSVINQACQVAFFDGRCFVEANAISTYQDALYFLEELGLAVQVSAGPPRYELLWPAKTEALSTLPQPKEEV